MPYDGEKINEQSAATHQITRPSLLHSDRPIRSDFKGFDHLLDRYATVATVETLTIAFDGNRFDAALSIRNVGGLFLTNIARNEDHPRLFRFAPNDGVPAYIMGIFDEYTPRSDVWRGEPTRCIDLLAVSPDMPIGLLFNGVYGELGPDWKHMDCDGPRTATAWDWLRSGGVWAGSYPVGGR